MDIEKLFFKKQELPILHETCFQIPIHPKLLDTSLKLDEEIAKRIFPEVAQEWCKELKKEKFPTRWEDLIQTNENGLVTGFQISRDYGGGLYFDEEDSNCQIYSSPYIKFSDEKRKEFQNVKNKLFIYAQTNVDSFEGALFLRNWAMVYMNEVFKQVF
ncbi:MAG: hypothetical protein WC812_02415 [Candidatus Pacearchaeota archaeon]|jgi:hypothetical protein